jgi:glycosyltransferase involved in cell wall biosynthesis
MEASTLSVGICTRDRPEQLSRALESVTRQTLRLREILVVDNAPTDGRTQTVTRGFPGVTYLCEPRPGLDVARNHVLSVAKGDVVAFLDDDAIADPSWASAFQEVFSDPRVGACTGRVEALEVETEAQRLFEANGGFSRGTDRIRLPLDAGDPAAA